MNKFLEKQTTKTNFKEAENLSRCKKVKKGLN
jgi:hypothetical protein